MTGKEPLAHSMSRRLVADVDVGASALALLPGALSSGDG
jgi:hypothetical protein